LIHHPGSAAEGGSWGRRRFIVRRSNADKELRGVPASRETASIPACAGNIVDQNRAKTLPSEAVLVYKPS